MTEPRGRSRSLDPPNASNRPSSSPCASIADDSGVQARMPASMAMAAARLTSAPTPSVTDDASLGAAADPSESLPPESEPTPYLRSIASRCLRALFSRYARIFSDASRAFAPLILPWIFALSASDKPWPSCAPPIPPPPLLLLLAVGAAADGGSFLADGGKDARFLRPEGLTPPITSAGCDAPSFDASPLSPITRAHPDASPSSEVRFAQT
mmetsp:Transcript_965/g.3959  ORF Transcript_965/g.3959 Transcript_965/m.3959 type:complete len:211 (+) Transcript_965:519-1151(+)